MPERHDVSRSYRADDVTFLLKPLAHAAVLDVADKERLIQSGEKHYSEMISPEKAPSASYMNLFRQAWARNGERSARDLLRLAAMLDAAKPGAITLVSLARGGTPVGVVLKRLLQSVFARTDVVHYSVSIIRDRGIDANALDHILAQGRDAESIAFIDGWTGKGVITRELCASVTRYNQQRGARLDPGLWVLADLAGVTPHAASRDDYLIPSSILNATVSGLVSRSILDASIGDGDFHGCLYFHELERADVSRDFVDDISRRAEALAQGMPTLAPPETPADATTRRQAVERLIADLMHEHGVSSPNFIKPGIGEATRVLLRRNPGLLILREDAGLNTGDDGDTAHLRALAAERGVPIVAAANLGPYQAIAIIKELRHAPE